MPSYTIRPGDHLPRLALTMGFDADAVWNHPNNAELKQLRGDPHILAEGDVLYVPEPPPRNWAPATPGSVNKFVAHVPTLALNLKVGIDHANSPFIVHCPGQPVKGTVDGTGLVACQLPCTTRTAIVELPRYKIKIPVDVGQIDPIEQPSGMLQRLQHLGYLPRDATGGHGISDADLAAALPGVLIAFQTASKIDATGLYDAATIAALKTAHGC